MKSRSYSGTKFRARNSDEFSDRYWRTFVLSLSITFGAELAVAIAVSMFDGGGVSVFLMIGFVALLVGGTAAVLVALLLKQPWRLLLHKAAREGWSMGLAAACLSFATLVVIFLLAATIYIAFFAPIYSEGFYKAEWWSAGIGFVAFFGLPIVGPAAIISPVVAFFGFRGFESIPPDALAAAADRRGPSKART